MVSGMFLGQFSDSQRFVFWLVCCISYGIGMVSHAWNQYVDATESDDHND
jgi:hypothetical protein